MLEKRRVRKSTCVFFDNQNAVGAQRAPHGAPRCLPGAFLLDFDPIQDEFQQLVRNKDNANRKTKCCKTTPEEKGARATNDNSCYNKAGWHKPKRGGGVGQSPLDVKQLSY